MSSNEPVHHVKHVDGAAPLSKPTGGAAPAGVVELRRLHWSEIETAAAIDAQAFGPDAWTVEFFWAQLAIQGNHFVVAQRDGDMLGFAGLSVSGPQAEILTIAVAPAAQGAGVGTHLLEALLAHAHAHGVEAVYLDVRADNSAAISLYERHGFAEIGRRPGYYSSANANADAVIMRTLMD